jgi:prefoldin subunit 5
MSCTTHEDEKKLQLEVDGYETELSTLCEQIKCLEEAKCELDKIRNDIENLRNGVRTYQTGNDWWGRSQETHDDHIVELRRHYKTYSKDVDDLYDSITKRIATLKGETSDLKTLIKKLLDDIIEFGKTVFS